MGKTTFPANLPSELVPAATIQQRWHISPQTLRRAAAKGLITSYRFGPRPLRYAPNEVMEQLCTPNRDWAV